MVLHPRWAQYTDREINDIKRSKCMNCRYSPKRDGKQQWNNNLFNLTCDYLLDTGRRRPHRPEECPGYPLKADEVKMRKMARLVL